MRHRGGTLPSRPRLPGAGRPAARLDRLARLDRPVLSACRRGFSFVEIMFAVMILGIGFILVAGIFPVALTQTQASGDETVASTVAREGANYIANLPNTST